MHHIVSRLYPHAGKTRMHYGRNTKCISNSHSFLTCKGVLQCSLRPLGTDLISLAAELCMTIITGLIAARYHQHWYKQNSITLSDKY